jgi:hypothetical protein
VDHFPDKDWIEFSRGMLSEKTHAAIQSHLDDGCSRCLRSFRFWTDVLETAGREPSYQPSAGAVRIAKAAFDRQNSWKQLASVATIARLVFDSLWELSPATVRSGVAPAERQLLHEVDAYVIDLRLQTDPVQGRISLIGQILNSNNPGQDIDNVEVKLINSNQQSLARTVSNPSGEFYFDFSDEDRLQLYITIQGQQAIGIILPGKQ